MSTSFQDNYFKSITLTLHILNKEALEKLAEINEHLKIKIHSLRVQDITKVKSSIECKKKCNSIISTYFQFG